ncbi:MAG: NAD(P)H-dependent oxidoreductase [Erysipelotrichaceae bacterium]|nr:NAD(P)H-dependent oxidoreductase [Erysipelotrichaceae bacterium]
MKKCLFIDCCIRREESRTLQLAREFLDNLKGYEIEHLLLEEEGLKPLVGDFFFERQELLENGELDHPRFDYAHEFADADMVVMAAPFWDLNFPALLKIYIENISVDGITFTSTAEGLKGLCKAENLVYFTTRGGIYKDDPLETADHYLSSFVPFFGFGKYTSIAADGMDIVGYDSEGSLNEAKEKARKLAEELSI